MADTHRLDDVAAVVHEMALGCDDGFRDIRRS